MSSSLTLTAFALRAFDEEQLAAVGSAHYHVSALPRPFSSSAIPHRQAAPSFISSRGTSNSKDTTGHHSRGGGRGGSYLDYAHEHAARRQDSGHNNLRQHKQQNVSKVGPASNGGGFSEQAHRTTTNQFKSRDSSFIGSSTTPTRRRLTTPRGGGGLAARSLATSTSPGWDTAGGGTYRRNVYEGDEIEDKCTFRPATTPLSEVMRLRKSPSTSRAAGRRKDVGSHSTQSWEPPQATQHETSARKSILKKQQPPTDVSKTQYGSKARGFATADATSTATDATNAHRLTKKALEAAASAARTAAGSEDSAAFEDGIGSVEGGNNGKKIQSSTEEESGANETHGGPTNRRKSSSSRLSSSSRRGRSFAESERQPLLEKSLSNLNRRRGSAEVKSGKRAYSGDRLTKKEGGPVQENPLRQQRVGPSLADVYKGGYPSLEDYLSQPVLTRLLQSPTKIGLNNSIHEGNVKAYEEEKRKSHPFTPTLAPHTYELDANSPSLQMSHARQRRKYAMLSPPRIVTLLDRQRRGKSGGGGGGGEGFESGVWMRPRSASTVSSVWGVDSEILAGISAIRPPSSDAGGGRRGKAALAESVPLALTEKARKLTRSVGDLFAWQAMKHEAAEERAQKGEAARQRAQAEEDKEIFAFREKEYHIALIKYLSKKAKRAAKRGKKVSDILSMPVVPSGSQSVGGGDAAESEATTRLSEISERFRALHAPSHVTAESARLVSGMADRRIDVYDHAEMYAQARGQAAIEARLAREAEKTRWQEEEARRLEKLERQRSAEGGGGPTTPRRGRGVSQADLEWFLSLVFSDPSYN